MRKSNIVKQTTATDVVRQILRMSQKAMACTLALIGVGYVGGLLALFFRPDIAEELTQYASIFTPVWSIEIGMYGVGSTLENLTKVKNQINSINQTDEENG